MEAYSTSTDQRGGSAMCTCSWFIDMPAKKSILCLSLRERNKGIYLEKGYPGGAGTDVSQSPVIAPLRVLKAASCPMLFLHLQHPLLTKYTFALYLGQVRRDALSFKCCKGLAPVRRSPSRAAQEIFVPCIYDHAVCL